MNQSGPDSELIARSPVPFPGPPRARALSLIHLTVPDIGFVSDVLESLSLCQPGLIPISAILTNPRKDRIGDGFPEVKPVIADDQSKVMGYVPPFRLTMSEP